MKKLAVLFVYVCLLLLSGSQYIYASIHQISTSTNSTHHSLEKRHRVKFTNQDTGNSLIEDALDIDEEHFGGGDIDDGIPNKFFIGNYNFFDRWYQTHSGEPLLNHYQKNFKIFAPFCGQSNPIYITHRVLRI